MAAETEGQWSPLFDLSNVAVHVHLLPNGKVLYWGRRENPRVNPDDSNINEHFTKAFVWDPDTKESIPTANKPLGVDGNPVNIFCAGHAFLPDGTLLIAGGHIKDGWGSNQACVYDYRTNTFTPKVPMNHGRWYPSVITLPDGRAMVMSGSEENYLAVNISQIWPADNGTANPSAWIEARDPVDQLGVDVGEVIPLYPRVHLSPTGRIITVGPQARTWWFDVKEDNGADIITPIQGIDVVGRWTDANIERKAVFRDYSPSVLYETGKIMYIGGGLTAGEASAPTKDVEFLDLTTGNPTWNVSPNMSTERRQFNATLLADGTVLVTGGTKGPGFNDLSNTVHKAELYNPATNTWTDMASEELDRCYHGTALLLPDGQVLSAGSGEYAGVQVEHCHVAAQLYQPPYLCQGGASRPVIATAPTEILYNTPFDVTLSTPDAAISKVTFIRLGSVTHCRNMNQTFHSLPFTQSDATLSITAPANANLAVPGHYMLFVLDDRGVPSVAKIIRITASPLDSTSLPLPKPMPTPTPTTCYRIPSTPTAQPTLSQHSAALAASQNRPPIVVGLTPVCPYGLGPCWAGAFDALRRIADIHVVDPVPSQTDSVAYVYPKERNLIPDVDVWRKELEKTVNGSYEMRGVEVTLQGVVQKVGNQKGLVIKIATGDGGGKEVKLGRFGIKSQVRWDFKRGCRKTVTESEEGAWARLEERAGGREVGVMVTGSVRKEGGESVVDVREWEEVYLN